MRVLPLAMVALRDHRRRQLEERLAAGPAFQLNDFVFDGLTGQPLDLRNIAARHFKPLLGAFYPLPNVTGSTIYGTHSPRTCWQRASRR